MNDSTTNVKALFLGPQAENASMLGEIVGEVIRDFVYWRRNFHPEDGRLIQEADKRSASFENTVSTMKQELFSILADLKRGVPFHSPRYLGHINSDLLIPAITGYIASMIYNQNNVTGESSPVTTMKELEYIDSLAAMVGFRPVSRTGQQNGSWGHLTSGGTTANLEAVWVARNLKYYPMSLKLLSTNESRFKYLDEVVVRLPGGKQTTVGDSPFRLLFNLSPQECFSMRRSVLELVAGKHNADDKAAEKFEDSFKRYSVQSLGIAGITKAVEDQTKEELPLPRVYISRTAHYCWKKNLDIIGLGQSCIKEVDVDAGFRMDVDELRKAVDLQNPTLMVVGVVGTTEEGAIDPLHEIVNLREDLRSEDYSFWVHSDSAYGGYFASMLPDIEDFKNEKGVVNWGAVRDDTGHFLVSFDTRGAFKHIDNPISDAWVSNLHSLSMIDSIVVDPHKLGYVPYPAGAVLFADGRAKDVIAYDAPYLAWKGDEEETIDRKFLGRWTLEGSRPGAAAIACYLSQHVLPHNRSGYGTIMAENIIAAQRLYHGLQKRDESLADSGFEVVPLCPPETNIVCYVVSAPGLIDDPRYLNELSDSIFDKMTVKGNTTVSNYEYVLSKTSFEYDRYGENLKRLMQRAGISHANFSKMAGESLTVLRSVLMNPLTADKDDSFFDRFRMELIRQADNTLPRILLRILKEQNRGRLPVLWIENEMEFERMRQQIETELPLGHYLNISITDKPNEIEKKDTFDRNTVAIVDLNLINHHQSVNLRLGFETISKLQKKGVDKIIVYSQYLREDYPGAGHIREELTGDDYHIPPDLQIPKSHGTSGVRKDMNILVRKIFRLAQQVSQ